jgi:hypothetical protein
MNVAFGNRICMGTLGLVLAALLAGCATRRIDWNTRVGNYTYDQAVLDLGPPDKYAKLGDGTVVAEWLTSRGYSSFYSPSAYTYSPFSYVGTFPSAYVGSHSPDYFLRLICGPDGKLRSWKKFAK